MTAEYAPRRAAGVALATVLAIYGGLGAILVLWVSTLSDEYPSNCDFVCGSDHTSGEYLLGIVGYWVGPLSFLAAVPLVVVQVTRRRRPGWQVGVRAALGGLIGGLIVTVVVICMYNAWHYRVTQ